MRILCPNYSPIEENGLLCGLRRLGHEVYSCCLQSLPPDERGAFWRRTWAEVRPDLIFNYGYWYNRFTVDDLDPPRGYRPVPFVYWACDDPLYFHFSSLPLLPKVNLVLTTTEEYIPIYRGYGCRAGFLQHCCNPELHRRVKPTERHQFVLVANNYGNEGTGSFRLRSTKEIPMVIADFGFDIKVWGLWWTDSSRSFHLPQNLCGDDLPYERLAEVYAGASIVLGLQFHNLSRTQTSCRIFEALGCRAFYLGPDTRGTRAYFESGRHLALSNSARETLALAQYYLEHTDERVRIAANGQMEVYRKHTHIHRASEFLSEVSQL